VVIAKPEWFKKNKGILSLGVTWQGTVYLLATVSLIFIGMMLPQNVIITVTVFILVL